MELISKQAALKVINSYGGADATDPEGEAGGKHWTGKRNRGQRIPEEMKMRWRKTLA